LFESAGIPPGVVNIVTGYGNEVGEPLVTHPDVAKVAFTGGDRTGEHIYQLAARSIKHVTLELGGKSANIVFDDADLDQAINGVVSGIFAATGQTCVAGSRALIHRPVHDRFVERLLAMTKTCAHGRSSGPWRRRSGRSQRGRNTKRVLDYIRIAKEEGAVCRIGGGPAHRSECGSGWFVEPTIFTNVSPDMRIANEEVFGPVLSIIPFDDEAEAVAIANRTVLRSGGGRVDHEHTPGDPDGRAPGSWNGLGEHLSGYEFHVAIWRVQTVRFGSGKRH
jgi:aldehyde dehydrogenase (NAD+)